MLRTWTSRRRACYYWQERREDEIGRAGEIIKRVSPSQRLFYLWIQRRIKLVHALRRSVTTLSLSLKHIHIRTEISAYEQWWRRILWGSCIGAVFWIPIPSQGLIEAHLDAGRLVLQWECTGSLQREPFLKCAFMPTDEGSYSSRFPVQ